MYIYEYVNKCIYMNMQVNVHNYDLGGKLRSREKYWQARLFTLTHGMNRTWGWVNSNRKGYRKKKKMTTVYYLYSGCLILFNINVLDYIRT